MVMLQEKCMKMKLKNFELKSQKCLKIGGSIIGYNVLRVYVRVFCDLKQINMECKRCGAYSYSRKSSLCSKCKYDLKIEKAVENARMRAKNLHIHAVIPALQHSDAMCFHECPNCNEQLHMFGISEQLLNCRCNCL